MLMLLAELDAKPECVHELESVLRNLVRATDAEPGSVFYAVHRSQDVPTHFVVYELYRDRAACDAHLQSDALQQALARFDSLLNASPRLTFCDLVAMTAYK